jgi:cell division protein FtsI/penicillin-binding protein 2
MAELKNLENELDRFRLRLLAAGAFVVLAFSLLAARLTYLQVVRYDDLSAQAETNRTAVLPIVPNRGRILDRHGEVLATNYSAYTLEITPSKVEDLDATIDELANFCRLLEDWKAGTPLDEIRRKHNANENARANPGPKANWRRRGCAHSRHWRNTWPCWHGGRWCPRSCARLGRNG